MEHANLPLAGVIVLDFGQVYQGPYATMLMAKGGADVIKIEPPNGEPLRRRAPPGKSTTFPIAMLNGNKRAITLESEARARPRAVVPDGREGRHPAGKFRSRRDGPARRRVRGAEPDQPAPRLCLGHRLRAVGAGPRQSRDGSDRAGDGRADQRHRLAGRAAAQIRARPSSISSPASISTPRRSRRCSSASAPEGAAWSRSRCRRRPTRH